ncbi:hypothetical protein CK203_030344 [Vitis vinifera]|uniref:Uncharacterized protein n=1 Tax=Vitis vinifera TaxID=29760 RepID=A0A438IV99_VITVI|nr:hypothetical protein CK203_030344 [Vitis vinifera]
MMASSRALELAGAMMFICMASQQNAAKKLGPSTMELRTPKTARPPVCLKKAISSIYGIKLNYLSELPGKCEVSVPYKIDPSIECLQGEVRLTS